MLIANNTVPEFDLTEIHRGTLIRAKHRSWSDPVTGFVASAKKSVVLVQYPPTIQNVTNHFFIPAKEAADGQWEIRYTNDMETIAKYPEEGIDESEDAGTETSD